MSNEPVLVVGGTGHLGGQVVDALQQRGKQVRALVRPTSEASKLEAKGVEVVRGDMLDKRSLAAAMSGVDAVVSTAAGYTRRNKNATEIDTVGQANLAEAAADTDVRRFVLTSILTCDLTPQVSHFWHKKLAEDALERYEVPFVALRPGAFLDMVTRMGGDPFAKKRLMWFGTASVPLTFVLASDLARYLAEAVDADVQDGERIDIGWQRPVSMHDIAEIASRLLGEQIKVRAVPTVLVKALTTAVGLVVPGVADMGAMLAWFETGKYVADTTRQEQVFGHVPTPEEGVSDFARRLGHVPASA